MRKATFKNLPRKNEWKEGRRKEGMQLYVYRWIFISLGNEGKATFFIGNNHEIWSFWEFKGSVKTISEIKVSKSDNSKF